jgi:hypothetical protein
LKLRRGDRKRAARERGIVKFRGKGRKVTAVAEDQFRHACVISSDQDITISDIHPDFTPRDAHFFGHKRQYSATTPHMTPRPPLFAVTAASSTALMTLLDVMTTS